MKLYQPIKIYLITHFGTNETRTIETSKAKSFQRYLTTGLYSNQIQVFNIYCVKAQSTITK